MKCKLCLNNGYHVGYSTAKIKILSIINNWEDTSIKEKGSKIAVMITNGGYIKKFDLIKKIKGMK